MRQKIAARHRAWSILAAGILFQGLVTGIMQNCMGVLYAAICQDLGFSMGSMSLFSSIRGISMAIAMPVTISYLTKKNFRKRQAAFAAAAVFCFMVMASFHHLWQWYILAIFSGAVGSAVMIVPTMRQMNHWFIRRRSFAIGLVAASTGLFGAIGNPLCSWLTDTFGWRTAVLALGILILVIAVPLAYFQMDLRPEDCNQKPYGWDEQPDEKKQAAILTTYRRPHLVFALCLLLVSATGLLSQYNSHLATFGVSQGLALSAGASITAFAMLGNVFFKIILGTLGDRKGVYAQLTTGLLFSASCFLTFFLVPLCPNLIYLGGFLNGAGMAVGATTVADITPLLYTGQEYERNYSRLFALSGFVGFAGFSCIGYSYDLFGSYYPSFAAGLMICALAGLSMIMLRKESKE